MVKIPGFDELKKMSSDLMDSAKTVKFSGMVDKLKSGMESMGGKKENLGDDPLNQLLQEANATLAELITAQTAQQNLIRKLQSQLSNMARVAETYQKPIVPPTEATSAEPTTQEEDKKNL
ncbi:MAG: hypothetical protein ABI597_11890 [Gammaproteobacteria bacterium]